VFHKYTWNSPKGKMQNQIDHVLTDRRQHSSILDVQSLRRADCDTDYYLVAANVRKQLAWSKQSCTEERYGQIQSQEVK
jgi:hypothetical protein